MDEVDGGSCVDCMDACWHDGWHAGSEKTKGQRRWLVLLELLARGTRGRMMCWIMAPSIMVAMASNIVRRTGPCLQLHDGHDGHA